MLRSERGGKRKSQNLVVTWPQALRRVRAWLEPYLLLRRYWQAWSVKPPPQRLQRLLDYVVCYLHSTPEWSRLNAAILRFTRVLSDKNVFTWAT